MQVEGYYDIVTILVEVARIMMRRYTLLESLLPDDFFALTLFSRRGHSLTFNWVATTDHAYNN